MQSKWYDILHSFSAQVPKLWEEDNSIQRLVGLSRAFVDMDGNMLTFTVTDVEEFKRAMAEPENFRHLRVRMGGWSAYFIMLSEEQQRLHVQRVEDGLR